LRALRKVFPKLEFMTILFMTKLVIFHRKKKWHPKLPLFFL
jgi:hypothetical protein